MFVDGTASYNSGSVQAKDLDPSGWELALVTTPSSNVSSVNERQLVGPFSFLLILLVMLQLITSACLLSK